MALSITHSYVSAVPDAGDASLVQPSDWNDTHDISGLAAGIEDFLATPSSANLATAVTDDTGSGALVFANTPTLVTPVLGAATGTSVVLSGKLEAASIELGHASANTLTASGGTLSIEGVAVLTANTGQPLDSDLTSWAGVTRASGFDTFAATPSLANLGSLLTDEATGLITFMTTPSSANLATLVTDETGSGALVFGTSPTFTTGITTPIATITQGTITDPAVLLNMTSTWNDAADTFTAIKLNVTNTNSNSASMLVDLQVGGVSQFYVDRGGSAKLVTDLFANAIQAVNGSAVTKAFVGNFADQGYVNLESGGQFGWSSTTNATGTKDVTLYRDAAATLALRNSTTAQTFRVYNTESSSLTNYERLNIAWDTNVATITTTAGGTGTVRGITITTAAAAGLTAQATVGAAVFGATGNGANTFIDIGNTGNLQYRFNSSNIMYFEGNSGHIKWNTDNTGDIGASGASRVRSVYVGTMVRTPKVETPMVSELTIATGAITVTGSYHNVDTEADAASDDLDTISGGTDGMRLVLRANNTARTVVVKDGTGNIQCAGDFSLDNTQDTMELIYDGTLTAWLEIGRSDSGA
jgi:hypothetical protein